MLWNRGADRGGGGQRSVRGEEPLEDLVGERPLRWRIEYFRAPFEREEAIPGKEPGKRRNQERVETGGGFPPGAALSIRQEILPQVRVADLECAGRNGSARRSQGEPRGARPVRLALH